MPDNDVRFRVAAVESGTFDQDARSVDAVLATQEWIDGPFGRERLVITSSSVDMVRARQGLPWHDTHGPHVPGLVGQRVGKVDNIRFEPGRLVGTLHASRNDGGEALLRDIEDGIVTHVSIGYRILKAKESPQGLTITSWQPLEVSTPSVVADPAATIQRAMIMPDALDERNEDQNAPDQGAIDEAIAAERQRAAAVDAVFVPFVGQDVQALRAQAIAESWDEGTARQRLLDHLGSQASPSRPGMDSSAGEHSMDKFRAGAVESLLHRTQMLRGDVDMSGNEFSGMTLRELARESLRISGVRPPANVLEMVGMALTRAGIISHSSSDFSNILVDAANKSKQVGWNEAPETYEAWTRPGTLPDFKTGHRLKLSSFSDLDQIPENGEFEYGTFSDFKEQIQLATYGKLFSISRNAIINDDTDSFSVIPNAMARAAKRNVADTVYAIFSSNPTMSDSSALFVAGHSNYVAGGSGAAPSVTTLNTAYASMALQTDAAGNVLNVGPQFIIAGHTLRGTIDALLQSTLNPAEGTTTAFTEANIWRARLTPVYDARIDADDTAKWYLAANPRRFDTVEVATLNGVREPRLERDSLITVDGVILRIAHDWAAKALDWRNLYHNDGN